MHLRATGEIVIRVTFALVLSGLFAIMRALASGTWQTGDTYIYIDSPGSLRNPET
jgi:hypothetical protein